MSLDMIGDKQSCEEADGWLIGRKTAGEELTPQGNPVNLSMIWTASTETSYLDNATVDYLKERLLENRVIGNILLLEYDNATGVISTRKY